MARIVKLWPCVLSALLFLLAFPPLNVTPLIFVCLIPWLVELWKLTPKQAFKSGYVLGFIIVLGQMSFILPLIATWTGSKIIGFLPWGVCGFLGSFYFALAGWLINQAMRRQWLWLIPVFWAGIEAGRSYLPALAFPWFIISSPLSSWPALIQDSYFGSIYLVSALVVLVNLLLAWTLAKKPAWKSVAPYASFLVISVVISIWRYNIPVSGTRHRIAIGQPAVDMAFTGTADTRQRDLGIEINRLITQAEAQKAEMLVLPEGMVDSPFGVPPPTPFLLPVHLPILFGGRRGAKPVYQSAYAYTEGKWEFADKTRLVPFGEYVPGRDYFPFIAAFKLPQFDIQPAEKVTAIQVGSLRVGPLICFEGLFFDVAYKQTMDRSRLLAVMSIDDWYMGTIAPEQLRWAGAWRAAENGLPLVRSASLGYTLATDARGRIVGELPLIRADILVVDLVVPDEPQGNRFMPVFPWGSLIIMIGAAIGFKVYRKKKPAE